MPGGLINCRSVYRGRSRMKLPTAWPRGDTSFAPDSSRHYPFPWMLRATAEAYANGNATQRVRALLWLEEAFRSPLRAEDFHGEFWTMAETLFALRHVAKR